MNKYEVVITQRAFADISECVLFVNAVSNEAAQDLYKEIIESIKSLESFPNAYPDIEGLKIGINSVKRMPIHNGRYIIVFKVSNNTVTIYDILDSRKDNSILKI